MNIEFLQRTEITNNNSINILKQFANINKLRYVLNRFIKCYYSQLSNGRN